MPFYSPGTAWIPFTPTYTNLTVGNGVHQSYYQYVNAKTVIARIGFTLGTTSSVGTAPYFTLPVTSAATYTDGEWIGGMRYVSGAAGFMGYVQWRSTTTAYLLSLGAASTDINLSATAPGVWTTGNYLMGTIVFEAA